MPNFWQDIENLVITPIDQEAHAVATDVAAWLSIEKNLVVADFQNWWAQQKALWTKYSLSQIAILKGLVTTAAADAAAGDYTAIATDVIKQATTAETAWIAALSADELAALVAVLAYKPAA